MACLRLEVRRTRLKELAIASESTHPLSAHLADEPLIQVSTGLHWIDAGRSSEDGKLVETAR